MAQIRSDDKHPGEFGSGRAATLAVGPCRRQRRVRCLDLRQRPNDLSMAIQWHKSDRTISTQANLVVVAPPRSQSVLAGDNVEFDAWTFGSAPMTYQWQFNGTNPIGR